MNPSRNITNYRKNNQAIKREFYYTELCYGEIYMCLLYVTYTYSKSFYIQNQYTYFGIVSLVDWELA